MTNNVTIDYKLTGTGWAICHIDLFGTRYTVTASYLSDALLALVNGTNHLLAGGAEARFSFDEEPGEYRWILRRTGDGGLAVRILAFPQLWGGKPDEDGDVLADATCQLGEFARALLLALNSVLEEVGVAGYRDVDIAKVVHTCSGHDDRVRRAGELRRWGPAHHGPLLVSRAGRGWMRRSPTPRHVTPTVRLRRRP